MGISLIELALGRFPFADSDSDDSDLSDLEGTLSPSKPGNHLPAISAVSRNKTDKKEKRKSKGVSLQGGGMTMSILELLQHIVNEPAPKLTPEGRFLAEAEQFVDSCLLKDPDARPPPKELLVSIQGVIGSVHNGVLNRNTQNFQWMQTTQKAQVDLVAWATTI
jgi:mitogen-activated protein kinase kinase